MSGGFATSNHNGSEGHRSSMEMSAPRSQVIHPQLRSMSRISNHREIQQQHGYTMLEHEQLHEFGSLSRTFSSTPPGYFPRSMGTAFGIPPMMPQQYDIDRRGLMGGFVQMASSTRVGGHPRLMPTHLAMSDHDHASSSITVEYHKQTLKRKAMITDVQLGSSTNVVVESNKLFGFTRTCQEEVQMHSVKKMKTMTLSLSSEGDTDDAVDRASTEIQFFPPSLASGLLGNDSEFPAYEWSSSGDGSDVPLDLSLKLSSSGGGSDMPMDLSLKLYSSGA